MSKKLVLLFIVLVISCQGNNNFKEVPKTTYYYNYTRDSSKISSLVEVGFFLPDTLVCNKKYDGEFLFINRLHDSIHRSDKDSRSLSVLISISKGDERLKRQQIDTFNISIDKINDTIRHKFELTPFQKGENSINIYVEEAVFLYSEKYFKDGNYRLLNNSLETEHEIYVE